MNLIKDVVENGFCIGCGICASVNGSPFQMRLDKYGMYKPYSKNSVEIEDIEILSEICPFSDGAPNEDTIAYNLYPQASKIQPLLGRYEETYGGWVNEGEYRKTGSSGGMGTWILGELLKNEAVTHVVNVIPRQPTRNDPRLVAFEISSTIEGIRNGAKSRYYPVEYSEIIEAIRKTDGTFVLTGLPCFIKAIRLLCRKDEQLQKKIKYTVALFCGHLKSAKYYELFCWDLGVAPDSVSKFDFRRKMQGVSAHKYGVEIESRGGDGRIRSTVSQAKYVFGTSWAFGLFKYSACEFCDDVFGETADIVIGDAWIPEYDKDWRGANVVIVRNKGLKIIIDGAISEGKLAMSRLGEDRVVRSQRGSVRYRREGLAYRLFIRQKEDPKGYLPKKRVAPDETHIDDKRKEIYRLRMQISEKSHELYSVVSDFKSFKKFKSEMRKLMWIHNKISRGTFKNVIASGYEIVIFVLKKISKKNVVR